MKKFRRYLYSFCATHERDGQTDTARQQRPRLCSHRAVKTNNYVFESQKKLLFRVGPGRFMIFPGYGLGTECNNHVANRSPKVVRHDVKHVWIFLESAKNFTLMLTDTIKQIKNKYYCNASDKVTFRPRQAQRKCPKIIATTAGNLT